MQSIRKMTTSFTTLKFGISAQEKAKNKCKKQKQNKKQKTNKQTNPKSKKKPQSGKRCWQHVQQTEELYPELKRIYSNQYEKDHWFPPPLPLKMSKVCEQAEKRKGKGKAKKHEMSPTSVIISEVHIKAP